MSFVSATVQEGPIVWQQYLSMANDVKPWLQIPTGSVASDTQLSLITDVACTWVQNYLSRPIAPITVFRRFDGSAGWNGSHIMLPYAPVIEVVSVVEFWGASGPRTLAEQTPESQGVSNMYQVEPITGRISRTFLGLIQRPWFPGARNVEITWVAGFNPVPSDIKFATLKLIKHWWDSQQQASRTAPVPAGAGEYHEHGASMYGGVPPEVEMLLAPYLQFTVA